MVMSTSSNDRVLSVSMRPKALEELIGQEDLAVALERQFASGRLPHLWIFSGPVGCGKTTLARIVARMIHESRTSPDGAHAHTHAHTHTSATEVSFRRNTYEINAANKTGVDDMRSLVAEMKFLPLPPAKAKVIVLDEAHQLSTAAQNALLTETEDAASHVFFLFCTSNVSKIIPALQRRAYLVCPRQLRDGQHVRELVRRAAARAGGDGGGGARGALEHGKGREEEEEEREERVEEIARVLTEYAVTSPGLVLQAVEKYFGGLSAVECAASCVSASAASSCGPPSGLVDTKAVCRAVVAGNWEACAATTKDATRADVWPLRASTCGYLKTVLLRSKGARALNAAKAIRLLSVGDALTIGDDINAFLALLCTACFQMAASS